MKSCIKLVFLAFALAQINYASCEDSICPDLKIQEDISDPFIAQSLKRDMIHSIWNIRVQNNPTELLVQLSDIILDMADSDSFYFTEVAFQYTGWSYSFLSEVDHVYPNFCVLASIINNTAEWQETGNVQKYIDALNDTFTVSQNSLSAHKHASLVALDCQNVSDLTTYQKSCYQNGLVSNQDAIWEVFGRLMPWPLRNVAQLLTESPLFSDRAYAAILAFVLTPPQHYYHIHQPYQVILELGRYYVNAFNNSKCCCDYWDHNIQELNDQLERTGYETTLTKINELLNEC